MATNGPDIITTMKKLADTKQFRLVIMDAMLHKQEKQYHDGYTDQLQEVLTPAVRKKLVAYYQSCIQEWQETVDRYRNLENRYRQAIQTLPDEERTVLYMLYINGLPAEEVAEKLAYSTRGVYKIRKRAIRRLKAGN